MNNEVYEELEKLMSFFPDSFINRQLELILIPKTNTFFSLKDCFTKKDIISKVLMWCTRDIAKARKKECCILRRQSYAFGKIFRCRHQCRCSLSLSRKWD